MRGVLLGLLVVFSVTAGAQSLKSVFQAKYSAYEKAFVTKDQTFLPKLLAKNYTAEQEGRPIIDRDASIKTFAGLSAATQGASWKRDIRKVTLKNGKAIVLFDGHFRGKMLGPDRKPHDIALDAANEDTWVKEGGDWKIEHSKVFKFSMRRDGKAVSGAK